MKIRKLLGIVFGLVLLTSCGIVLPNQTNTTTSSPRGSSNTVLENFTLPTDSVNIHTGDSVTINATGIATNITASDVVDAVGDSVVEILVEIVETDRRYGTTISQGAGSGVIVDSAGYIITNNHVIEGATNIYIKLRNGDEYEASLVATDAEADIAALYITPNPSKPLTYAVFGDSDNLRVAQDILVIGNPLGSLGGSVTKGIISALDRAIQIDDYVMNLLQVDAAVNPGNSGGALFDMTGHLVGIVNAKSVGEDIDGIGFAIPSNDAKDVFNKLCTYGYVNGRTALDIEVAYTTYSTSSGMWRQNYTGVFVTKTNSTYGVQEKDYIYKIDDVEVSSMADIYSVIRNKQIGETVTIYYYRNFSSSNAHSVVVSLIEDIPA